MEDLNLRHYEAELRYLCEAAKNNKRKHCVDDENTLLSGSSSCSHQ